MQIEITLCSAEYQERVSNRAKLNGTDKSSKPPYSNSKRPPWSFANLRCSQRRVMSPCNDAALWSQVCNRRFGKNNFRQNAGQMTDTKQIKQTKQTNKQKYHAFNFKGDFNRIESQAIVHVNKIESQREQDICRYVIRHPRRAKRINERRYRQKLKIKSFTDTEKQPGTGCKQSLNLVYVRC